MSLLRNFWNGNLRSQTGIKPHAISLSHATSATAPAPAERPPDGGTGTDFAIFKRSPSPLSRIRIVLFVLAVGIILAGFLGAAAYRQPFEDKLDRAKREPSGLTLFDAATQGLNEIAEEYGEITPGVIRMRAIKAKERANKIAVADAQSDYDNANQTHHYIIAVSIFVGAGLFVRPVYRVDRNQHERPGGPPLP